MDHILILISARVRMRQHAVLCVLASVLATSLVLADTEAEAEVSRGGKALSVFNVVTFPNSACGASSGYNGTCYTSSGEWTIKVDRFSYNGF